MLCFARLKNMFGINNHMNNVDYIYILYFINSTIYLC